MADFKEVSEALNALANKHAKINTTLERAFGISADDLLSRDGNNMSFGGAIAALRQGKKVARIGWNGKGMWLWLKKGTMVKSEWCCDPELKAIADNNGGEIEALGTICMKTADNKILSGWLASQTDMLSNDWIVVE